MNSFSRKLIILVTILTTLAPLVDASLVSEAGQEAIKWETIGNVYNQYLEYPSTENARMLYEILPKSRVPTVSAEGSKVIDRIYRSLQLLGYEMMTGDRNAVRVVFRLFNISDADFSEQLESSLAHLIRIHPKLFLEELELHKSTDFVSNVKYPLYGVKLEFIDRFKARKLEYEMRIKALEGVTDNGLRPIRDECVRRLREHIKKYY